MNGNENSKSFLWLVILGGTAFFAYKNKDAFKRFLGLSDYKVDLPRFEMPNPSYGESEDAVLPLSLGGGLVGDASINGFAEFDATGNAFLTPANGCNVAFYCETIPESVHPSQHIPNPGECTVAEFEACPATGRQY